MDRDGTGLGFDHELLRAVGAVVNVPIVVAAGSDDPDFVRAVYKLNGNCFMRKPGELPEFAKFIEACYEFWGSVVTLPSHRGKTASV